MGKKSLVCGKKVVGRWEIRTCLCPDVCDTIPRILLQKYFVVIVLVLLVVLAEMFKRKNMPSLSPTVIFMGPGTHLQLILLCSR